MINAILINSHYHIPDRVLDKALERMGEQAFDGILRSNFLFAITELVSEYRRQEKPTVQKATAFDSGDKYPILAWGHYHVEVKKTRYYLTYLPETEMASVRPHLEILFHPNNNYVLFDTAHLPRRRALR